MTYKFISKCKIVQIFRFRPQNGIRSAVMGELDKKVRDWEQKKSGSNKNGRNSKLRLGAGRSGEIKVGDWEIQTPHRGPL